MSHLTSPFKTFIPKSLHSTLFKITQQQTFRSPHNPLFSVKDHGGVATVPSVTPSNVAESQVAKSTLPSFMEDGLERNYFLMNEIAMRGCLTESLYKDNRPINDVGELFDWNRFLDYVSRKEINGCDEILREHHLNLISSFDGTPQYNLNSDKGAEEAIVFRLYYKYFIEQSGIDFNSFYNKFQASFDDPVMAMHFAISAIFGQLDLANHQIPNCENLIFNISKLHFDSSVFVPTSCMSSYKYNIKALSNSFPIKY